MIGWLIAVGFVLTLFLIDAELDRLQNNRREARRRSRHEAEPTPICRLRERRPDLDDIDTPDTVTRFDKFR